MKRELGHLGERRLGIAVIWFLPEGAVDRSATIEGISAEDRELVQSMMGMDAEVAVGRLQELGRKYRESPERLRAEVLSAMGGDEIATQYLMGFITKIASADQSSPASEHAPEETEEGPGGQVIEFPGTQVDEEDDGPDERE